MSPSVRSMLALALFLAAPLAAQEEVSHAIRPGDRVTLDVFTAVVVVLVILVNR